MFREFEDFPDLQEAVNRLSLELHECVRVNFNWTGSNIHPFCRLFAVVESNGKSYVEKIGGKRLILQKDAIYFMGAAEEYSFHFEKGNSFYSFHFDTLTPSGEDFFYKSGLFIEETGNQEWIGELNRIFNAPTDPAGGIKLKALLFQKILKYLPGRERTGELPPDCERALFSFLRNKADARTMVAELAEIVHLSADTFSRRFSKRNGIPVKRYLNHAIAARASRLLRDPSLKIKDVAKKLNFQSEYYFSRFYKRETAQTPSEFRKNIR